MSRSSSSPTTPKIASSSSTCPWRSSSPRGHRGEGDIGWRESAGKDVLRYEQLLADQPRAYEWPDIDERSAAAMCYTSGTTGHPKGVVYGHRSTYLHSMAYVSCERLGCGQSGAAGGSRTCAAQPFPAG